MAFIRNTDWTVDTGPVVFDTVNAQAVPVRRVESQGFGDWERNQPGGWIRRRADSGDDVYVNDNAEPGVFRALACGTLLGSTFACPDAAREAADAYLVGQGRLDKSRAFVRLGEWEDRGALASHRWVRRQYVGCPMASYADDDKGRECVDAELAGSGLLDPSRAFKAGPVGPSVNGGPLLLTGATGGTWGVVSPWPENTATMPKPEKHNSGPTPMLAEYIPAVEAVFRKFSSHAINQPAKPAWGEWERVGNMYVRGASNGRTSAYAEGDFWAYGQAGDDATDIDDAREKADAFLVARGELEAGRAFKRVGDWDSIEGGWVRDGLPKRLAAKVDSRGWQVWTCGVDHTSGSGTNATGKEAADAELVRRGLLAEGRAFKVAEPFTFNGDVRRTYTFCPSAPGAWEVSHDDGVTWEQAQAGVTIGPKSRLRHKAQTSSPTVKAWAMPVVSNAHEAPPRGFAKEAIPKGEQTVTLANWEHHLPALLSGAPREFRDGFNRKQGPAWEAYLRGLAWVKEEMQCGRQTPCGVRLAIAMAAAKAEEYLGPEWVKANVR